MRAKAGKTEPLTARKLQTGDRVAANVIVGITDLSGEGFMEPFAGMLGIKFFRSKLAAPRQMMSLPRPVRAPGLHFRPCRPSPPTRRRRRCHAAADSSTKGS